jgi:hypothetical protein
MTSAILNREYKAPRSRKAIHITKVSTIKLQFGNYTSFRRLPAVPQIQCINGCTLTTLPKQITCLQMKKMKKKLRTHSSVKWKCQAEELDNKYLLSNVKVDCEGYRSSRDMWILAGSCGVEYDIKKKKFRIYDYMTWQNIAVIILAFVCMYITFITVRFTLQDFTLWETRTKKH